MAGRHRSPIQAFASRFANCRPGLPEVEKRALFPFVRPTHPQRHSKPITNQTHRLRDRREVSRMLDKAHIAQSFEMDPLVRHNFHAPETALAYTPNT